MANTQKSNTSIVLVCITIFTSLVFIACNKHPKKINRGIYYWKNSIWYLQDEERKFLQDHQIKTMYVKYFEVYYDENMGATPTAKTYISLYNTDSMNIIPVVYVRNELFKSMHDSEYATLAKNMLYLIDKYSKERFAESKVLPEIQIDCDWTISTKEKYFKLLSLLKQEAKRKLTCTLRLYPYKYDDKMGIPPVDEAVLMCYNLMNPLENKSKNSILDIDELKKYLSRKKAYPLPLTVALPTFSWMQLYQMNNFKQLIHKHYSELLPVLKPDSEKFWYAVTRDTVVEDMYIRQGDKIKAEAITEENLSDAIELLNKELSFSNELTVLLYHLDANQLKPYSHEALEHVYNDFLSR